MKRGQVTIYISLGIALVISIIFILYMTKMVKEMSFKYEEPIDIASEQNSVKLYTQSCLKQVLENALNEVKSNGGYTTITRDAPKLVGDDEVGEYIVLESLPDVESEIGTYIDHYLRFCINNFAVYEERGWEIKGLENIKTSEVAITENEVIASVNFPVEFKRGDVSFTLDKFIARKTVPLKKILDETKIILETFENINNYEIEISEFLEYPDEGPLEMNGLEFKYKKYENPLTRPNSYLLWVVEENNFKFQFAIKLET